MSDASPTLLRAWIGAGGRFLPFADAVGPDLPLGRLLRLSLFQVAVGMAAVLVLGTLNRVMIVELEVPASLVGVMISLPLLFAPARALIGFRSDTHRCELGWRRVPFMFRGAMVQFGGLAIMPFALLVLAGAGSASEAPQWIGLVAAGTAFLLVGAGLHTIQTVGLALATDLAAERSRPSVVGAMYVVLLLGMVASALVFGAMLAEFSHDRLVKVIQAAAVVTLLLVAVAVWKQEPRRVVSAERADPSFREAWATYTKNESATRALVVVALGTLGFGMADVLLEPYGGQVLGLSVASTTTLTAMLATGGLIGFTAASYVLRRGADPWRLAVAGAAVGMPAFAAVILAGPLASTALFMAGTIAIGLGTGLFGHATLTATMNAAPKEQTGLALGAWGAAQASAAGLAIAAGGIVRDAVGHVLGPSAGPAAAYEVVYAIEIICLAAACAATIPLLRRARAPE